MCACTGCGGGGGVVEREVDRLKGAVGGETYKQILYPT